jgi:hypothetical protein
LHAQPTPLPTVQTNDYAIEVFQGPLLAPIHVMGVGGAYIASAEDVEGSAVNTASPAVRNAYSSTWFDYDFSLGVSFPGAFTNTDFDNHGDDARLPPAHASAGNFLDANVGLTLQFGGLGVGATGDLQQFSLTTPAPGKAGLTMQIGRWKAIGAYAMFGGQLAIGGGARIATMQILQNGGGTLVTMTGAAPEVGALLMPKGRPWRIGATARAPVSGGSGLFSSENATVDANGVRRVGDFVLPTQVVMPWEIEVGLAYQVGPRPLNPGWQNPHDEEAALRARIERDRAERQRDYDEQLSRLSPEGRAAQRAEQQAEERSARAIEDDHIAEAGERLHQVRKARYENWPREKILLLASVLMTGPSSNAISVEGFLDQRVETAGRDASFTPRLGLEGEPLPNRMLLRTGTYVEPSRYDGGTARQHFTFGADVRLFPLTFWGLLPDADWKLGLFVDLAPRYTNWGLGLGNWH